MNRTIFSTILVTAAVSMLTTLLTVSVLQQPATTQSLHASTSINTDESTLAPGPIETTVAAVEGSVVSVIITKDLPVMERYYERVPGGGFTIRIPRTRQNGTEEREIGGGTAFFVSGDGLLMTNKHVVNDEDATYTVLLNDGRKIPATVVARHPGNDIAFLKIDGTGYKALTFADTAPRLGQTAIAIGNALGEFRNTVSVGVVSGLQRDIVAGSAFSGDAEHLDRIIQTDAAVNEGNSGGPLVDAAGRVIGMNTAIALSAQNIGFAIPSADLIAAYENYRSNGRIVQAYLGIRYVEITPATNKDLGVTVDHGILIDAGNKDEPAVLPNSPAAKAGLKKGDIILAIDDQELTADVFFQSIINRKQPGDTVTLRVLSGGSEKTITATLAELKV